MSEAKATAASRRNVTLKKLFVPAATIAGGGFVFGQANFTAIFLAIAVVALAASPPLWQLAKRIQIVRRSKDGEMFVEFEPIHKPR